MARRSSIAVRTAVRRARTRVLIHGWSGGHVVERVEAAAADVLEEGQLVADIF